MWRCVLISTSLMLFPQEDNKRSTRSSKRRAGFITCIQDIPLWPSQCTLHFIWRGGSWCLWRGMLCMIMNVSEGMEMIYLTTHSTHLRLYDVRHMVKDHSDSERGKTCCRHMCYSFRLAARVILYEPSPQTEGTYHGLYYTSRGALAGMRNKAIGPPWRIDPTIHRTMIERSYHEATSRTWVKIF